MLAMVAAVSARGASRVVAPAGSCAVLRVRSRPAATRVAQLRCRLHIVSLLCCVYQPSPHPSSSADTATTVWSGMATGDDEADRMRAATLFCRRWSVRREPTGTPTGLLEPVGHQIDGLAFDLRGHATQALQLRPIYPA